MNTCQVPHLLLSPHWLTKATKRQQTMTAVDSNPIRKLAMYNTTVSLPNLCLCKNYFCQEQRNKDIICHFARCCGQIVLFWKYRYDCFCFCLQKPKTKQEHIWNNNNRLFMAEKENSCMPITKLHLSADWMIRVQLLTILVYTVNQTRQSEGFLIKAAWSK